MSDSADNIELPDPHTDTLFGWPTDLLRQMSELRTRGYDEQIDLHDWREQHAALAQQAPDGAAAADDPQLAAVRREATRRSIESGKSDTNVELLGELLVALSGPPDDAGIAEHRKQMLEVIADTTDGSAARTLRDAVARNTRWLIELGLAEATSGLLWTELLPHRYTDEGGNRAERTVGEAAEVAGRGHPLFVHGGRRAPSRLDGSGMQLRRASVADLRQYCQSRIDDQAETAAAARKLLKALDSAHAAGLLAEYTSDPNWPSAEPD
jgi:hypothetical protein